MENGEPAYLAGKSGIELVKDIVAETTGKELTEVPTDRLNCSTEYWIGRVIAYYQWWSGKKYGVIFKAFTFDELQMYIIKEMKAAEICCGVSSYGETGIAQRRYTRKRDS